MNGVATSGFVTGTAARHQAQPDGDGAVGRTSRELLTARTGLAGRDRRITTVGDVSKAQLAQIGGTGVFVSALRKRLLSRRGRLRRALAQGPADAAGRRDRCSPRCRGGTTRGTRWSPGTAPSSPTCRPAPGSAPARRAAPLSCCCCGRTCSRCRSAATPEPGWARSTQARSTRSCSPMPDWPGSAGSTSVSQVFEPDEMMPAPGQGALAAECLANRPELRRPAGRDRRRGEPGGDRRGTQRARRVAGGLLGAGRRVCCRDECTAAGRGCRGSRRGSGAAGERERAGRPG